MKIKRENKFSAHVEASAMNDIMFFLLLFFLIVSTMVNPSVVKLMLPNSKKAQEMSKQEITISVTAPSQPDKKDQKYYLNNEQVPLEALEAALKAKIAGLTDPTAVLRFDRSLTIEDLVDVLQIGADLKVKMVLATQPNSK
jgi:biopolymer transport protein ExbD